MERTQNYSDKWIIEVDSVCSSNIRDHTNWSEYGASSLCSLFLDMKLTDTSQIVLLWIIEIFIMCYICWGKWPPNCEKQCPGTVGDVFLISGINNTPILNSLTGICRQDLSATQRLWYTWQSFYVAESLLNVAIYDIEIVDTVFFFVATIEWLFLTSNFSRQICYWTFAWLFNWPDFCIFYSISKCHGIGLIVHFTNDVLPQTPIENFMAIMS